MNEQSWIIYATVAVVVAAIGWIVFRITNRKQLDLSVSHKEQMFSAILDKAVGDQYQVFCKVPATEVFEPLADLTDRAKQRALNPVKHRLFDYLVCQRQGGEIVCAVELDDHEFDKKRFKKQDLFLEEICQEALLPLLRVAPQNGYNLVEIIERFERTIAPSAPIDAEISQGKFKLRLKDRYSV